jgi:hypothetical protein
MSKGFCFAKNGPGAVFGIMDSVSFFQNWLPTLERSPKKAELIDIDATNYKYKNTFYNPMEVASNELDFDKIEECLIEFYPITHGIIVARFH